MSSAQEVIEGKSVGEISIGMTRGEVSALLGMSTDISATHFPDHDSEENWDYPELGLSLIFFEEDGYKLGSITTNSPSARFRGMRIIGILEEELTKIDAPDLGRIVLEEDLGDAGKNYEFENCDGLLFWVDRYGKVQDATVLMEDSRQVNRPGFPGD